RRLGGRRLGGRRNSRHGCGTGRLRLRRRRTAAAPFAQEEGYVAVVGAGGRVAGRRSGAGGRDPRACAAARLGEILVLLLLEAEEGGPEALARTARLGRFGFGIGRVGTGDRIAARHDLGAGELIA